MPRAKGRSWLMLLGASALMAPHMAMAQSPREQALEERLARLEAEMTTLRADLVAARDAQAQTAAAATQASTRSEEAVSRLAALEAKPRQRDPL